MFVPHLIHLVPNHFLNVRSHSDKRTNILVRVLFLADSDTFDTGVLPPGLPPVFCALASASLPAVHLTEPPEPHIFASQTFLTSEPLSKRQHLAFPLLPLPWSPIYSPISPFCQPRKSQLYPKAHIFRHIAKAFLSTNFNISNNQTSYLSFFLHRDFLDTNLEQKRHIFDKTP